MWSACVRAAINTVLVAGCLSLAAHGLLKLGGQPKFTLHGQWQQIWLGKNITYTQRMAKTTLDKWNPSTDWIILFPNSTLD